VSQEAGKSDSSSRHKSEPEPHRDANNSATTPARQNQARGHVHHVAVEDAQAAPYVIIGMILVNDNNAIMLFDSGASHSFIAANFVQKHNLPYPC
jgi:hypothetical protein